MITTNNNVVSTTNKDGSINAVVARKVLAIAANVNNDLGQSHKATMQKYPGLGFFSVSNLMRKLKVWSNAQIDQFNTEQSVTRRTLLVALISEDHNSGYALDCVKENSRSKTYRLRKPSVEKIAKLSVNASEYEAFQSWKAEKKQLNK